MSEQQLEAIVKRLVFLKSQLQDHRQEGELHTFIDEFDGDLQYGLQEAIRALSLIKEGTDKPRLKPVA